MTREERRQRRRENRLLAICLGIIAVWVLCLLLSCNATAAYETAEAAEPDKLTVGLAIIGAFWVSWALMRMVEWLDKPHARKSNPQAFADLKTASACRFGRVKLDSAVEFEAKSRPDAGTSERQR